MTKVNETKLDYNSKTIGKKVIEPKKAPLELVETKRVYKEDMIIDTDTFKLEVKNLAKNVSFDEKNPLLVGIPHCHIFHTYDSNGKKMSQCNSVGGHTHNIEIKQDDQGNMVGICGPATLKKNNVEDNHTHEMTYLKSDKIKLRQVNPEAQKAIANFERIK